LGESNAFTLRVVCASDNANQSGPARIISNSLDTGWRNFTLGQQGRDMVFRFRTPLTGFNGSHPEVVVPGVFATDHRREILVTYDGGTLLATVANSDQVYRTELTPGASLASKISSLNIQADELQMINVMYLAALFFLPAVLVGLLGQTGRGGLAFGVLWVLVFGVLLEGTLVLVSGRPFEWGSVAANVVVGVVVLTLSSIGVRGYLEETWFLPGMPATETRSDA
jgi:hypothetical protein